jgi:hypothetical protein
VRSGRDLLINIPKSRAFEIPYLQKPSGPVQPALKWLYLAFIGLLLGGVAALIFASIAVFQSLRLLTSPLQPGDRVRVWIVLALSGLTWFVALPISWLFMIRLFPS